MVVSGGVDADASGTSSKPTRERFFGTSSPRFLASSRAANASTSDIASTAVMSGAIVRSAAAPSAALSRSLKDSMIGTSSMAMPAAASASS
jgi:hypothetical protein